ncbi:DUF6525 family protein [Roseovarius sp. MBR-6]|uniref:DUF6525 family protein n=1 Tax=Roseovarius sp. MBR-6 TaxID=3156459 RepID=UPI00339B7407
MANLRSPLARRGPARGLAEFDRLPPPLRRWLAQAALPWSARSARRLWGRVLRESGGDEARALARLDAIEAGRLKREAALVSAGVRRTGRVVPRMLL